MTQNQLDWMQERGLDPAEYDMTPDGRVVRKQAAVVAEPQREVMSPLRAGLTSFAGSVLPSAAGLGSAKLGMMAGAPFGPVGVGLGAIGGGLAGGYLAGKGQEAVLEKVAPEAIAEMQRAQTDQPVASYVGGFAPNALTFRPSLQGMSGLLRPTVRGEETLRAALSNPNFIAPAANVAANVGASTAGQLINVAEGGEFSGPRFAADVALGTLFNRPTALGKRLGFADMPQPTRTAAPDFAKAQDYAKLMADVPEEFSTTWRERRGVNSDLEAPDQYFTAEGKRMSESGFAKDYSNWWKSETEPTVDLLKGAAEEVKAKIPREKLKELSNDPEVGEVLRDPSKMAAFVAKQADESLEIAFQNYRRPAMEAGREVYSAELEGPSGRPLSLSQVAKGDKTAYEAYSGQRPPPVPEVVKTPIEQSQQLYAPELKKPRSGRVPSLSQVAKGDKTAYEAYSGGAPKEPTSTGNRFLTAADAEQQRALQQLRAERNMPNESAFSDVNAAYEAAAKTKAAQKNATDAAREVYTRLQRAPEEGPVRKISQEDINLANEVANRRGLKIELDRAFTEGGQEVRGMYFVDKNTGARIIRINPLMATADTAIHEIGHDIFTGVTNKGMRRSLMDTAMDSPAYKSELAARLKEGMPEAQARELALEEGLIQAFGEKMPDINRGELRAWFSAFKASMKQLVTGKMSPEDALAWMHYATTENVPWKGVATAKGGEERMQRPVDEQAINQMIGESVSDNIKPLVEAINLKYEDIINSTGMMPEMRSTLGNYIQQVVQENPSAFDYFRYKVGDKTFADKEIGQLRGVNEAVKESLLTGKPIELSESAANNYKAMAQDVVSTMRELRVDNSKIANIEQLLSVLVNRKIQNDPNIIQQNENVKRWSDPAFRQQQSADYKRYNYQRAAQELTQLEGQLSSTSDPSNPDIRYQRAQQETPEFKNWFGDSKIVDADGKPLTVYHGTRSPEDFNTFRTNTGHNYGPGAYFTPEPRRASGYAGENEGARVYSTYVKVEKPYIVQSDATVQDLGYRLRQDPANDALMQSLVSRYGDKNNVGNADVGNAWLRSQGYDGIIKQRNRYTENGYVPEVVEVVAFKPEQVKSATGNKGTFDPSNPDIRYQRPIGSEIKTPAELDYLSSKGGPFADVATNVKAAYNTRDFKQGQWSSKYSLTNALPEEARVRLLNHLAGEFDSGVRSTPAADIRAAYDQLRNEYLPAIVSDYNAQGFTVRDTAGQRARGSNPTYFPLHSIADEVTNILTTKQGSPEWDKLKADFINWNTQLRQADGASLAEAQRYADEKFQERVGITSKPPGIESGIPFSGARKPEGYPLPPSWRSNDIIDILNNYTRRSATDFAYQQHVESSPVAMAALGAKTMVNNQPIPANVLQSTPLIINEPSVQSVLREYRGTPAQRTEGALQSFGRFVSAATIGPVSKVGDIGTSSFKGLVYLPASEYINGLAQFTNKIADFAALKERSYASGLNKRDAAENMRQVLGIAEDSTAFMDKAARVLSKATFVNDLESVSRVIAQGWGETIVGINKKLALGGDKNATQMLDTLSPDWRTRSDADLAAQVGRLLQGSYDMRQLPASVLEGAAAPYLTWSKWSIGQYDSFMKYALQPAMQGNMKPLIGQMLIGVLGGGAISAVQEWLNNREGKDISWKELESWMQQNQGELGADGGQLLGQKLLSMAQKMGTFGFAGDLVKMTVDAAAGGASQGVATMPAIDAIYDVSKRAAAAGKALDDGEDFGLVLKALLQDSLTGHVQALRVARNWLDEDENLRYDDRRKRRLFDELSGLPSKGGTFAVNYSNLSERDFERGEITEKTGEEAFELVSRAREEATSPEDYASRIRKYKTSQNQIMPSLERQPEKAARYLSFVEGAEEGAGAETMRRYMTREYENKYRKSLIEGMSGLR